MDTKLTPVYVPRSEIGPHEPLDTEEAGLPIDGPDFRTRKLTREHVNLLAAAVGTLRGARVVDSRLMQPYGGPDHGHIKDRIRADIAACDELTALLADAAVYVETPV